MSLFFFVVIYVRYSWQKVNKNILEIIDTNEPKLNFRMWNSI